MPSITDFVKQARDHSPAELLEMYHHPFILQRTRFPAHRVDHRAHEDDQGHTTLGIDVHRFSEVLREVDDRRKPVMVFELDEDTITMGRDIECDIAIPHVSVSTEHATLVRAESGMAIVDRDSTNGVFVDGRRIEAGAPKVVRDRQKIALAALEFQYLEPATLLGIVEKMIEKMGGRAKVRTHEARTSSAAA